MEDLIKLLHEGQHSLVVANGDVCTFDGRGVSDLYKLFKKDPGFLCNASLADKVIGKAAAALMVLAEVKEVYADVISQPALDLLRNKKVLVSYDGIVPHIINRTKTGLCPLEARCRETETPEECLIQIEAFMKLVNKQ